MPVPPEPPVFDPQRVLEVLARHEVRCIVIGGYAAVLAGVDVVTRDIDITPAAELIGVSTCPSGSSRGPRTRPRGP